MTEKGKITELLSQQLIQFNEVKFRQCSRLTNCDISDLMNLSVSYKSLKKKFPLVTPLHAACYNKTKPKLIKTLVKEGWSVNHHVDKLGTPLEIALEYGNISVANVLISELGAKVKKFGLSGFTPMFFALSPEKKEKTCITAVKLLLDSGVSVDAVVDRKNEERPIHMAVIYNLPSVVSFLLQRGADPNVQDIEGVGPIHRAVHDNRLDIVKLLLLHGVDLHLQTKINKTPLCHAVYNGNAEIIKELVRGGFDINRSSWKDHYGPFHLAVFLNKLEIVKLMVSLGANPNKALESGTTPLHGLATRDLDTVWSHEKENSHDLKDMAEFLVDSGANLNLTDMNGNSPLQVCIISGFLGLAKCLIKLGADFNTRNPEGDTIFHQVVPLNRDIIILLLDYGGDFQAYNTERLTPYHIALSHMVDLKYIKSFIKHGCPYDQDIIIWTDIVKNCKVGEQFFASENKFFKGIESNDMELIKTAVMDGALATSRCERMRYPLHFVACKGYNEVLKFLLENNVQPNTLDDEGRTPLHLAASSGHYESCCILLRFGACYNYFSKKCQKPPRVISYELKHNRIVDLFDSVDDMFIKANSKKPVVKYFKSKLANNFDYLMFLNVINKNGNNLLTTALKNKLNDAKVLFSMRLYYDLGLDPGKEG